jgi:hypothetical protein
VEALLGAIRAERQPDGSLLVSQSTRALTMMCAPEQVWATAELTRLVAAAGVMPLLARQLRHGTDTGRTGAVQLLYCVLRHRELRQQAAQLVEAGGIQNSIWLITNGHPDFQQKQATEVSQVARLPARAPATRPARGRQLQPAPAAATSVSAEALLPQVLRLLGLQDPKYGRLAAEGGAVPPVVRMLASHAHGPDPANVRANLTNALSWMLMGRSRQHALQALQAGAMPVLLQLVQGGDPLLAFNALVNVKGIADGLVPCIGPQQQQQMADAVRAVVVLLLQPGCTGEVAHIALEVLRTLARADAGMAAAAAAAGAGRALAAWEARPEPVLENVLLGLRLVLEAQLGTVDVSGREDQGAAAAAAAAAAPGSGGGGEPPQHRARDTSCCRTCGAASKPSGKALSLCSGCRGAAYCSPACQKADWKAHKRDCAIRFKAGGS